MSGDLDDKAELSTLIEQVSDLHRRALKEYAPVVEEMLFNGTRDVQHIERTLDGLLDFCGHDAVLPLYRRLCRYYYDIDPAAAVSYVHAYREMWDSESEHFSEDKK